MEEMVVSCVIKHLNLVDALQSLINFQYQEEHAEEYDLLCKIMGETFKKLNAMERQLQVSESKTFVFIYLFSYKIAVYPIARISFLEISRNLNQNLNFWKINVGAKICEFKRLYLLSFRIFLYIDFIFCVQSVAELEQKWQSEVDDAIQGKLENNMPFFYDYHFNEVSMKCVAYR